MGFSSHVHVTSDEIGAFDQINPEAMNDEESILFNSVLAKEECCEICRQRIMLYETLSLVVGGDLNMLYEAFDEELALAGNVDELVFVADNPSLVSKSQSEQAYLPIFDRAAQLIDSAGSSITEKAREIIADWTNGLQSVASLPQVCFVPVAAGTRGNSQASGARGLEGTAMVVIAPDANESIFEFNLNERQKLFIKVDIDERVSLDNKYNAIIMSGDDHSTLFVLELGPNRKNEFLISEHVELEPGHYYCIILSDDNV